MRKKIIFLIATIIPVVFLDQISKYFVNKNIPFYAKITIIKHFFNLVHVDNAGIAFGLMQSISGLLIILLTAFITIAILIILFKVKLNSSLFIFSSSLIISGAFSNLMNRIFQGYVVDFIDVHVYSYHWPSFNVADSCVVTGTFLFFISIVKYL